LVILARNKIKPLKSNYGKALVLGIAYAATIGGIGSLVGSTPNVIAAKFLNEGGIAFSFTDWMYYGLPFVILFIPVAWVLLTRMFKSEVKQLKTIPFEKKLTRYQKKVLIIFGITVLLWLTTKIHGIESSTISLVPIILLYVCGLLDTDDFAKINWATLILIGGGLSLGLAIQSSGLDMTIAQLMQVTIISQPLFIIFVGIAFFAILLTVVASNTAAAAVMIPLMFPLAAALNLPVTTVVMLAAIGVSLDFIVPVGTPPSAIAYSSGFVRVKDMAKAGVILAALGVLLLAGLALLYW
jgi:sodium-dependent dicarboxylate transporter 2/3/5